MTNLELQKAANEVRKGIITGVHAAKAGKICFICLWHGIVCAGILRSLIMKAKLSGPCRSIVSAAKKE